MKESWKGVSEAPDVVYGHGSEASCDIESDEGVSYLVYARCSSGDAEGALQTSLCNSTRLQEEYADGDLLVLGPPEGALPDAGALSLAARGRGRCWLDGHHGGARKGGYRRTAKAAQRALIQVSSPPAHRPRA